MAEWDEMERATDEAAQTPQLRSRLLYLSSQMANLACRVTDKHPEWDVPGESMMEQLVAEIQHLRKGIQERTAVLENEQKELTSVAQILERVQAVLTQEAHNSADN